MKSSAIHRGGLHRLNLIYPGIDFSDFKLVGWGAGQSFRDYFQFTDLKLSYTICPFSNSDKIKINGLEIRPPESLHNEDPQKTLILVFSAFTSEIYKQISVYGKFRVVNAIGFADNEFEIDAYQEWLKIYPTLKFTRSEPKNPLFGIFTQGPITDNTPICLARHKQAYPEALHILIADEDEAVTKLKLCEQWVDKIILAPRPSNPSCLNKNLMIRSCYLGAKALVDAGVKYGIRTRTDTLLIGSVYKIINRIVRSSKLGKIAIPSNGWKHVPFHFSDMLMVARSEDLLSFWSCPEDNRVASHPDFILSLSDHYQEIRRVAPESYLWENYASRLGFSTNNLADSYLFAKEIIIPCHDDFDHILLKYLPIFQLKLDTGFNPNQNWWENLEQDTNEFTLRANRLTESNYTIGDFYKARVF